MNTSDARNDPEDDRRAYAEVVEHNPRDPLLELREALDYDSEGDSELDALIAYKDALENRLRDALDEIDQREVWVVDVSGTGDGLYVFLDEDQARLFETRHAEATVTCESVMGQAAGVKLIANGDDDAE
jgi:hypothetical protein